MYTHFSKKIKWRGLNGELWDKISAKCEILYCKAGEDIRDMSDRCLVLITTLTKPFFYPIMATVRGEKSFALPILNLLGFRNLHTCPDLQRG
jgi:hypothetical protein